jgi:8-oxo-dGTP pyrophosphatase MutT (NUDIX family)
MPLTKKGEDILASMIQQYGETKGKEVFYASKNAGKISGVDDDVASDTEKAPKLDYVYAAGVLFLTPEGKTLFVKRGQDEDHPGEWSLPGGKIENGESDEGAARREAKEETGYSGEEKTEYLARHRDDEKDVCPPPNPECIAEFAPSQECSNSLVDFTTFLCRVPEEFDVTLNAESIGYAWAPVNDPPQPLHPGVIWALNRLNATTELDVASAMSRGELTSPQPYSNVTLFDIRITGTGMSYRHAIDEFVWRDPSIYLNQEFLQRCNGLPVIIEHPKNKTLNSEEFKDRIIGTVLLPYIKNDEVWAIAKIYDDAAIKIMSSEQLSTSPAVVFTDDENLSLKTEDGKILLIEGKPSLLDHIAICEQGVWDKGGEPKGVSVAQKEVIMTEEEKPRAADDKARHDAEEVKTAKSEEVKKEDNKTDAEENVPAWAAKILSKLEKLEALEAEEEAEEQETDDSEDGKKAEKAADSEDEEEEKADAEEESYADARTKKKKKKTPSLQGYTEGGIFHPIRGAPGYSSRKAGDSEIPANLMERVDALEKAVPKSISDEDYHEMAATQAKADSVYGQHGVSAPRFSNGENLMAYRKRLADGMKSHSKEWKNVNIYRLDDSAFGIVEKQIYADAAIAARHPDVPAGILRAISERSPSGHTMTRFVGDSAIAFNPFMQAGNLAILHKPTVNN